MSPGVIDRLEAVQIHIDHGKAIFIQRRLFDGEIKLLLQHHPVGQRRQVVMHRQLTQFLVSAIEPGCQPRGAHLSVQHRTQQGDPQNTQRNQRDPYRQSRITDAVR